MTYRYDFSSDFIDFNDLPADLGGDFAPPFALGPGDFVEDRLLPTFGEAFGEATFGEAPARADMASRINWNQGKDSKIRIN